ncbi:MAG: glutamate 5-kinase [Firmicutes bacterium]|nr:glutamate 5-kinase [Bacillota bacterium]
MSEIGERMIGFIGAGNMASAMIRSLVAGSEIKGRDIMVINKQNRTRIAALENECGVVRARDLRDIASRCSTLVLAVKPDQVTEVLESLSGLLRKEYLVISVAAGITLEHLQEALGAGVAVIRAMPNTPARVGEGATALAAGQAVSAEQRAEAELILGVTGKVYWVNEADLDIVTALSGSGPAYIYKFAQEMANAATQMGLDQELSGKLARQTLIGAGRLLKESGASLGDLIRQVTSPRGTTAAALKVLETKGLGPLVEEAMVKATFRSHEMSGLPGRHALTRARRVVIKVGSIVIAGEDGVLNESVLADLVSQIAELKAGGREVIVVSSGAIVAGRGKLGAELRGSITEKQALAAVGQGVLMAAYQSLFERHGVTVAQILLTGEDFSHPRRSTLCHNTLSTLLERGVVPVINENDTVAVDEIRLGDNDALSARVAVLMSADLLVLLTDTAGLCTNDPKIQPGAEPVTMLTSITPAVLEMASGGQNGTGGMVTKLWAANLALEHGIPTVIADGTQKDTLNQIIAGKEIGTFISGGHGLEAERAVDD